MADMRKGVANKPPEDAKSGNFQTTTINNFRERMLKEERSDQTFTGTSQPPPNQNPNRDGGGALPGGSAFF